MNTSKHLFRAYELRKVSHPVLPEVEKYWLSVRALDFPAKISNAANARDPEGMNRRVYRDVRASLEAKQALPGTFDLMNKGITILAQSVRLVDKEQRIVEVTVDNDHGGIVDGAHTARIIDEANEDATTNPDQYVEVYIRTGIPQNIASDIARGLNTGIQVAAQSIYNVEGVFDWLQDDISKQTYKELFSWKESDDAEYDVRDLIGILEVLNIFDFPNDDGKHPISAYEKWSIPLDKFAADYRMHKDNLSQSTYYRLRGLLPGALCLYDYIRRDFRDVHNRKEDRRAGNLKIVEQASAKRKTFDFPFAKPALPVCEYRLTKGAAYPILAAFRNYVEVHPRSGLAVWRGGFKAVLGGWKEMDELLVAETYQATKNIGRNPDQIGKNRQHWDALHTKVQNRLLRAQVATSAVESN
jgi:hypothetical protein